MGTEFEIKRWKGYGGQLHNNINILNTCELYDYK